MIAVVVAAGLDIDEFLPKHLQDTVRLGYVPQPEMSESEAMQAILRGHKSLVTALSHRRKNIQIVLATWSTKDARLGLEQAIHMDDQSVIVDILNVITLKPYVRARFVHTPFILTPFILASFVLTRLLCATVFYCLTSSV